MVKFDLRQPVSRQHSVIGPLQGTGFSEARTGGDGCLAKAAQMENFVHSENLKLYRKVLAETTDEQKRQTLLKLLSDEEAKDPPPSKKGQS
jgi:hypothetical protein